MIRQHKITIALLPLAWIYGLIQRVRNLLFDTGLLNSKKASVRTVVVGNLAVGGTGKTPHVIWLASELSKTHTLAILSRGYRRKSKGFRWVQTEDHPKQVGDEPLEMKTLLPDIPVAVDTNRHRALKIIQKELNPPPDLVILDDGFQHRRLIPDYAVILSHAKRPFYSDQMMPAGRLREPKSSISRANSLIITNTTPGQETGGEQSRKRFGLREEQQLFNSSFEYLEPIAITDKAQNLSPEKADAILLVTGIAWPDDLQKEMETRASTQMMRFPDHHPYMEKDIQSIISTFKQLEGKNKIIVTTGKDAMKLKFSPGLEQLPMYYLSRQVIMTKEQKKKLIESINHHG